MVDTMNLDERIAKCEKILAADASSQIFAALADAYRKRGDITRAREICLEGLKIHPDYSSAHVVMSKIYLSEGNFASARDELNKAVRTSGRSRAIDILEAEILIRLGRLNDAGIILERLYSSDPDDELVLNLLSMIGQEKRLPTREDEARVEKAEKRKSYSLSEVVSLLKIMPRVMGVIVVSGDGLVLEGRFDGSVSKDEVGALSKSIFDMSTAGSKRIHLGDAREILIETPNCKLWIFNKERFLLTIFSRDDVSMGSLKLKIENLLSKADMSIGEE